MKRSAWISCATIALAAGLAAVQLRSLTTSMPPPDALTYFDVADQIQRVGYARALPLHWSPLYPVVIVAMRLLFHVQPAQELAATARLDAACLVALSTTVVLMFAWIAGACWPDRASVRLVYTCAGAALGLYFAFGVLRVGLRMPDALVAPLALCAVWAWCRALFTRLDLRWCAAAGLLSGLSYLARANLLHWSVLVGLVACIVAPAVPARRRASAYLAFAVGLIAVVGPQTYVLSRDRGYFTVGESGKIVFAETYGAVWPPDGHRWPVRPGGGDVRIFTERHDVRFPGFYDPGREFDDAVVPFRWRTAGWGLLSAVNATLFGFWAPSFSLAWALLWALWPIAFALADPRVRSWHPLADQRFDAPRLRIAVFLILAGAGGLTMHLLSKSIGYYLTPYLTAFFMGLYIVVLELDGPDGTVHRRAVALTAAGFVLFTVLWCAQTLRPTAVRGREAATVEAQAMASVLGALPAAADGHRRIAAVGDWLGLYGVRLSNSQLAADIPDPEAIRDPVRRARAMTTLRKYGFAGVLARRQHLDDESGEWKPIGDGTWALLDLRSTSGGAARP
jgi:hypothetical protein